jgi:hypothetical protein
VRKVGAPSRNGLCKGPRASQHELS